MPNMTPEMLAIYRVPGPAIISFSGGRTSGYLLWCILQAYDGVLPGNIYVCFCNTGLEHPLTLEFVAEVDRRWGVRVIWLEFDPTEPNNTKIVNHNSASRNGEPLSAAIATRPTPHLFNPVSRYCTGQSKINRLRDFAKHHLGWSAWNSVIGLRHDEPKRVAPKRAKPTADRQTFILPLDDAKVTKEDVAEFWRSQEFDLQLPNDKGVTELGNCVLCYQKKIGKIRRILATQPSEITQIGWWIAQEDMMEARVMSLPVTHNEETRALQGPKITRARFRADRPSYRVLDEESRMESAQAELFPDDGESVDCHCTD